MSARTLNFWIPRITHTWQRDVDLSGIFVEVWSIEFYRVVKHSRNCSTFSLRAIQCLIEYILRIKSSPGIPSA